jgi:hypothetical protein
MRCTADQLASRRFVPIVGPDGATPKHQLRPLLHRGLPIPILTKLASRKLSHDTLSAPIMADGTDEGGFCLTDRPGLGRLWLFKGWGTGSWNGSSCSQRDQELLSGFVRPGPLIEKQLCRSQLIGRETLGEF